MDDPTIGLVNEPKKKAKKSLVKAGEEHESGRPRAPDEQGRLDGKTEGEAWEEYKDVAAEYAKKAQVWKDAQEKRDVRMDDLVKVHAHRPFDDKAAQRIAKETAKAIEQEKAALEDKQAAKKALDAAWTTVQSFAGSEPVRPLIQDDE